MKKYTYEGKNLEELKAQALIELNKKEEEVLMNNTEKKSGLFKNTSYVLDVYSLDDVAAEIKNYLQNILTAMSINATFETKIRDAQITIKMYSDKNNILIGRNGQTLQALQILIRQHIYQEIKNYPYILLDVENYKEKQEFHLERLAERIGREVSQTKHEVIMDNMNSYERRIVHNIINEKFKNVTTISEGEEPNRHIVVKPKED